MANGTQLLLSNADSVCIVVLEVEACKEHRAIVLTFDYLKAEL